MYVVSTLCGIILVFITCELCEQNPILSIHVKTDDEFFIKYVSTHIVKISLFTFRHWYLVFTKKNWWV